MRSKKIVIPLYQANYNHLNLGNQKLYSSGQECAKHICLLFHCNKTPLIELLLSLLGCDSNCRVQRCCPDNMKRQPGTTWRKAKYPNDCADSSNHESYDDQPLEANSLIAQHSQADAVSCFWGNVEGYSPNEKGKSLMWEGLHSYRLTCRVELWWSRSVIGEIFSSGKILPAG